VQWLRDQLGIISGAGEIEALAASVQDNSGIYFVPAFSGLFAPYWDYEVAKPQASNVPCEPCGWRLTCRSALCQVREPYRCAVMAITDSLAIAPDQVRQTVKSLLTSTSHSGSGRQSIIRGHRRCAARQSRVISFGSSQRANDTMVIRPVCRGTHRH